MRKFICITLVSLHLRLVIWDGLTQFELSAVEKAACSLFNSRDVIRLLFHISTYDTVNKCIGYTTLQRTRIFSWILSKMIESKRCSRFMSKLSRRHSRLNFPGDGILQITLLTAVGLVGRIGVTLTSGLHALFLSKQCILTAGTCVSVCRRIILITSGITLVCSFDCKSFVVAKFRTPCCLPGRDATAAQVT